MQQAQGSQEGWRFTQASPATGFVGRFQRQPTTIAGSADPWQVLMAAATQVNTLVGLCAAEQAACRYNRCLYDF